jgi:tRNA threonylcarbamoyladenosine biosynthesis protein TsaE
LIQEYDGGRTTVYHVDLYRLEPAEIADLGLDELVSGDGIVAVEWADRWNGWPDQATHVQFDDAGDNRREIRITRGERAGYSTR